MTVFQVGDVVRVSRLNFSIHDMLGVITYCPRFAGGLYTLTLINGAQTALYPDEFILEAEHD